MIDLFCGCNVWRMCLYHRGITRSVWIDDAGVHHVRDLQAEYAERCRAVAIMAQFRKVLAVIAWVAETDRRGMWPLDPEKYLYILRHVYSEDCVRNLAERGRCW